MGGQLDEYQDWLTAAGYARTTVRQRVDFAARCRDEWGTWAVQPPELAAWLADREGWTARTYYNHLRTLYAWLVESGRLDVSPLTMRRPKSPDPRPEPLSPVEVTWTLGAAAGHVPAVLVLGYFAGLRSSEIAAFRGESITPAGIYVVGKGGQGAMVPTHPAIWEVAQTYPRQGWWFPSPQAGREHVHPNTVSLWVRTLFREHGIAKSVHRARTTYGTTLLRGGANIRVVQKLMRHRSLSSTEHYLGVHADELTEAIRRLAA